MNMIKQINLIKNTCLKTKQEMARMPVISGNADFYIDNKLAIVVRKYPNIGDLMYLNKEIEKIRFQKTERTAGLKTQSMLFGYAPRNPLRRNYCNQSVLNRNNIVINYLDKIRKFTESLYKELFKEVYENHKIESQKILKDWKFQNSIFSSGIVNKNNELDYHKDRGNIKNCLSNMLVIKSKSEGGYLMLPEYSINIECAHGDIVIFNGQDILHDVSNIANKKDGNRFSIVYYTLEKLWQCLPYEEEIKRANEVRNKSEIRKLDILKMSEEEKQQHIKNLKR